MDNTAGVIKPEQIIEIIFRRRWFISIPFCLAMMVGIYFAFTLPKVYEAQTLILIEAQRVPEDYVQPLVTEEINDRINTISQQILSRSNLEKLISELNLFSGSGSSKMFIEDKLNILRNNIFVDVTTSRRGRNSASFTISYRGKDPEMVAKISNILAFNFNQEHLKNREMQAGGISDFLDEELSSMRMRLEEVEEVMKNYRTKFMGQLPEQLASNLNIMGRIEDQIIDRGQRIADAKIRLTDLENQLASAQSQRTTGVTDPTNIGEFSSIGQLKERLAQLRTKYTNRHPDIIRLEKMISDMEAENKKISEDSSSSDNAGRLEFGTGVVATYKRQLVETKREIKVLQSEITDLNKQKKVYQIRVENTPKREQELMTLKRDYQNIQDKYNSLLNRKLESEIAVNMVKQQKGERFKILDPAKAPISPVEPDLKQLFLLIVAAGLGLGGGIVFLLEYTDTSFRRTEDVETYLGVPVLTTIPPIYHPDDIRKQKLHQILSVFSLVILFVLFIGFAVVTLVGPDIFTGSSAS